MTFSGFPAELAFSADNRREIVIVRVYDRARLEFDFREIREAKVWAWADALNMRKANVSGALDWLVEAGYLVEHRRGERGIRRFTLAWTVSPAKRPGPKAHPSVAC